MAALPLERWVRRRAVAGAIAIVLAWFLPIVNSGTVIHLPWDPYAIHRPPGFRSEDDWEPSGLDLVVLGLGLVGVVVALTLRSRARGVALLVIGGLGFVLGAQLLVETWSDLNSLGDGFPAENAVALVAAALAVTAVAAGNHLRGRFDTRCLRIFTCSAAVAVLACALVPEGATELSWAVAGFRRRDVYWPFVSLLAIALAHAALATAAVFATKRAAVLRRATTLVGRYLILLLPLATIVFLDAKLADQHSSSLVHSISLGLKASLLVLGVATLVGAGLVGTIGGARHAVLHRYASFDRASLPSEDARDRWSSRWMTTLCLALLVAFVAPVVWIPGWRIHWEPDGTITEVIVHPSWGVLRASEPRSWAVLALPALAVVAWLLALRRHGRARGWLLCGLSAAALVPLALATGNFRYGFDLIVRGATYDPWRGVLLSVAALAATTAAIGNAWLRSTGASGARLLTSASGVALVVVTLVAVSVPPLWANALIAVPDVETVTPLLAFAVGLAAYGLLAAAAGVRRLDSSRLARARSLVGRVLLATAPVALFVTSIMPKNLLDGIAALTFAVKATGYVAGVLGLLSVGVVLVLLSPSEASGSPAASKRDGADA